MLDSADHEAHLHPLPSWNVQVDTVQKPNAANLITPSNLCRHTNKACGVHKCSEHPPVWKHLKALMPLIHNLAFDFMIYTKI